MNLIDLVIVIMLVWGAWTGCRKGLLISVSKLVGNLLGIVVGIAFYKPFAEFLGSMTGVEKIFSRLGSSLMNLPANLRNLPIRSLSMSKVQHITESINIPVAYQKYIQEMLNQLGIAAKRPDVFTVGDALNHMAGGVILQMVAWIILLVAVGSSISLLLRIISKAINYTPVGVIDQGGGLAFGAARVFLVVAITLVVINPLLSIGLLSKGYVGTLCKQVGNSQISNYIIMKVK